MKIVQIIGGLGNQMFQFAFYSGLKEKYVNVKLDTSSFGAYTHNGFELDKVFHVEYLKASIRERIKLSYQGSEIWIRVLRKLLKRKKTEYVEPYLCFDENAISLSCDKYYIGYWQSYKYFTNIEAAIRGQFHFSKVLSDKNEFIKKQMQNSNSVSLHVRLGDYVNNPAYSNICTSAYYNKAINIIQSKVSEPKFFVFSDDTVWCKDHLKIPNCHIIDWNNKEESYWDMCLMTYCKHNIIANSSFSWWGAWLNTNPERIVIAPGKWINDDRVQVSDIIPSDWICV